MARASDEGYDGNVRTGVFARRAVAAAVLLTVATLLVIWLAAVPWGPMVCPAIQPPEPHCVHANRVGTGAVVTAAVLAIGVATAAAAILGRRRHGRLARAGIVLLVLSFLAAYPVVAWSPGFSLAAADRQAPDPAGTWVDADGGDARLTISAVGTFEGFDGCNGFSGSWTRADAGIAFHDTVMSLMMCTDVDDWLSRGRFAVVDGERMQVLDESRRPIGELVRR